MDPELEDIIGFLNNEEFKQVTGKPVLAPLPPLEKVEPVKATAPMTAQNRLVSVHSNRGVNGDLKAELSETVPVPPKKKPPLQE